MSYLLDTCVLSEYTQLVPDPKVLAWIDSIAETRLYVSALSLGEIRQGAAHIANTKKSARLMEWLELQLLPRFEHRVLSVDTEIALVWGELRGSLLRKGKPASLFDSLIAATAKVHGFSVVTRNVRDFKNFEVGIINPWS
ncbi:type II toxin-antitoxin system VapC family toxin [Pseudolysobacter antarcticus]|uniref:type II toxin-antitoxin system VapC family toxin n=1 Tax=Pseudolysobacter antarcticus TaxID=2511995 RepID=UPI0013ED51D0|nr:type II toxin-antitoxin system VapC family toxin [Pseudolysobacter antarcticus]